MNTAQIRPEYQLHYVVRINIYGQAERVPMKLDDTYKIIYRELKGTEPYYILEVNGEAKVFPEDHLMNIQYEEYTLQKIEEELLELEPIRFNGVIRKRKESLEDFLWDSLVKRNKEKDTIYFGSKEIQTKRGKRRSLGDWFRICKFYYPDCLLKDVAELLYITFPETKDKYRSSYCSTINKRVFYHNNLKGNVYNKKTNDEYNKTWNQWVKILKD